MNNLFKLVILVFLSFFIISCSEDSIVASDEQNQTLENKLEQNSKSFDINSIRPANNQELNLISTYFDNSNLTGKKNQKISNDFENPEVVSYTNLPGKAIVLKYKQFNKSNSEKSLILVVGEANEVITEYEHEKIDQGDNYTIKTLKEGLEWFTADIDKDTEEIIRLNFSPNVDSKKMSFLECAEMAVGSCVNDGECAFICGIVWQYCLGSIGLACAYVTI